MEKYQVLLERAFKMSTVPYLSNFRGLVKTELPEFMGETVKTRTANPEYSGRERSVKCSLTLCEEGLFLCMFSRTETLEILSKKSETEVRSNSRAKARRGRKRPPGQCGVQCCSYFRGQLYQRTIDCVTHERLTV